MHVNYVRILHFSFSSQHPPASFYKYTPRSAASNKQEVSKITLVIICIHLYEVTLSIRTKGNHVVKWVKGNIGYWVVVSEKKIRVDKITCNNKYIPSLLHCVTLLSMLCTGINALMYGKYTTIHYIRVI